MSNKYSYEHTDTFGGEANYTWVKRGTVTMPELTHYGYTGSTDGSYAKANRIARREIVKAVKARCNLTGVRCETEWTGSFCTIRPRGSNEIIFIDWAEG